MLCNNSKYGLVCQFVISVVSCFMQAIRSELSQFVISVVLCFIQAIRGELSQFVDEMIVTDTMVK